MTDSHIHDKTHDHSKMSHEEHQGEEKVIHAEHKRQEVAAESNHSMHTAHAGHDDHAAHGMGKADEHAGHVDHSGHEDLFRRRFWVSLLLSIPVLLYTPMLQMWFGIRMPEFVGRQWITPIF